MKVKMRATLPSVILILIFAVLGVTSYDSKQFLEPRLVKVEIIDERGEVRAKMMEQGAPSASRGDEGDKEDDGGIDDEDSKSNEGSGDSSEHLLSDVANDQPFIAPNGTKSSSSNSTISPSPTSSITSVSVTKSTSFTPVIVTKNESYSAVSIVTSTKTLNSTVTASTKPTPVLSPTLTNPTTKSTNVVTSTQVVSSSSVTDVSTSSTVVVLPQVTTESTTTVRTTTERPTAIEITTQPSTNKPTTREPTVISKIETNIPATTEKVTLVNTTEPTEDKTKTTPTVVAVTAEDKTVLAHKDPTEKPRKTLFGFVTIEILIALLAGALFSILLVAFLVFRLKKRNEGSYELSETIALRPKELDEMSSKKEVFV